MGIDCNGYRKTDEVSAPSKRDHTAEHRATEHSTTRVTVQVVPEMIA